ncbi:MAG TPA: DUF3592 domain-containing protein [Polyangia bacterium]|nr:DUF3592 domain-containing protein [Polyangia bacterium]
MAKALSSQRSNAPFLLLFVAFFLVMGAVGTYFAGVQPVSRALRARRWTAARCTIVSSALRVHRGDRETAETYDVAVRYEWTVEGRHFQGDRYDLVDGYSSSNRAYWQSIADGLRPGRDVGCWVDPANPADAVLVRAIAPGAIATSAIPLAFVAVSLLLGRAALRKRPLGIRRALPTRPLLAKSTGPVALAPASTPRGRLATAVVGAVLWNGVLWSLYDPAIPGRVEEEGFMVWVLAALFVVLAAVGVHLAYRAARALFALAAPRVSLTASARAVRLGDRLSVTWTFRGNARAISRVSVSVVGSEIVRSRDASGSGAGTTRRQVRCFAKMFVASAAAPGAGAGAGSVMLPANTVPTFSAPSNEITWAIVVEASLARLPDVREEFPIVLLPAAR